MSPHPPCRALPPVQRPFPVHGAVPDGAARRGRWRAAAACVDDAWPAARARRLERLRDDRDGVLVRDPDGPRRRRAARRAAEAARLLPDPVDAAATRSRSREAWLLACCDDLVVLRRRGPARVTAELLAVAFPSGWPPRLRAGADLPALHAPVADGERLRAASGALSEALLVKGPVRPVRVGARPGRPARPRPVGARRRGARLPAAGAAGGCGSSGRPACRCPHLDRALFLIRPHLVPLTSLGPEQRRVLHDAVASMSPQALAYKGLTEVRDDLLAWLALSSASGPRVARREGQRRPLPAQDLPPQQLGARAEASPGSASSTHQAPSSTSASSWPAAQPA